MVRMQYYRGGPSYVYPLPKAAEELYAFLQILLAATGRHFKINQQSPGVAGLCHLLGGAQLDLSVVRAAIDRLVGAVRRYRQGEQYFELAKDHFDAAVYWYNVADANFRKYRQALIRGEERSETFLKATVFISSVIASAAGGLAFGSVWAIAGVTGGFTFATGLGSELSKWGHLGESPNIKRVFVEAITAFIASLIGGQVAKWIPARFTTAAAQELVSGKLGPGMKAELLIALKGLGPSGPNKAIGIVLSALAKAPAPAIRDLALKTYDDMKGRKNVTLGDIIDALAKNFAQSFGKKTGETVLKSLLGSAGLK